MLRQTFRIVSLFRGANIKYGQQRLQSQIRQLSSFKNEEKPSINESNNERKILIPSKLHKHLFPNASTNDKKLKETTDEILDKLVLPKLSKSVKKNGLMVHFDEIGKEQFARYVKLLEAAAKMKSAPEMPKEWRFKAGWTKYDTVTGKEESVEYPDEKVLFFDVEGYVNDSKLPCMAVAMSSTCWYSWCSDRLVNDSPMPDLTRLKHLIPLEQENGSKEPKIVIGHNIEYDCPRIREIYYQDKTGTRFWDTLYMAHKLIQSSIFPETCSWNLKVLRENADELFSCGEYFQTLKKAQDILFNGNIDDIRENFQLVTTYCAEDVEGTFEVFKEFYPIFRESFPHPITSIDILETNRAGH